MHRVCKLAVHVVVVVEWARGDVLREEELELLVGELAQLRTEHIVDSDVICIPAVEILDVSLGSQCGGLGEGTGRGRARRRCCGQRWLRGAAATHARYATARLGSWLKCSDSIKRSSRFQLIWDGSLGLSTGGGRQHAVKCSKGSHRERWGATGFSGRR